MLRTRLRGKRHLYEFNAAVGWTVVEAVHVNELRNAVTGLQ